MQYRIPQRSAPRLRDDSYYPVSFMPVMKHKLFPFGVHFRQNELMSMDELPGIIDSVTVIVGASQLSHRMILALNHMSTELAGS